MPNQELVDRLWNLWLKSTPGNWRYDSSGQLLAESFDYVDGKIAVPICSCGEKDGLLVAELVNNLPRLLGKHGERGEIVFAKAKEE